MTVRLFDQDAYIREFDAVVTACWERKNGWAVCLDRTAFYPEGGGQPGDRGYLLPETMDPAAGEKILIGDTHEKDGEVLHYTDHPLTPGTHVKGRIDWAHRFDLMQNHSGEHIVSGLIHNRFGYSNVGFHMGSDVLTIDLDGDITPDQLAQIEAEANEIVWQNVRTQIDLYTEAEAALLVYRSKKELHGTVRIVTFPGADVCACCGTHVSMTGEIGLIKLLSVSKFRSGVRIEMLCGRRAFNYLNRIWEQNHQISVLLSAKPDKTASYVEKLKTHDSEVSFSLYEMKQRYFEETAVKAAAMPSVYLFEQGLEPDEVRRLCVLLMEHCSGVCAVFSGDDQNGYKYALGQKNGNLKELNQELNAALQGRGGGKPFFLQGNVSAARDQIRSFMDNHQILSM